MSEAAKQIIRDAMDEAGFHTYARLMREVGAGRIAAKILSTWDAREQLEPMTETDYANSNEIINDVVKAMEQHGEQEFSELCAVIGEKMVVAAVQYILSTHEPDGEDVEQQIYFDELRAADIERRMWRRDRGL